MPDLISDWRRHAAAAAGAVVLVAVAVVVLRGSPAPPEESLPRATASPSATAAAGEPADAGGAIVVHAAGAVAQPGVYRLPGGSRVSDLLDAAGGPGPDADLDQLNLAARLSDGERIFVPRKGEPAAIAGPGPSDLSAGPLDLNTATADQLDGLPGVGPATAAAIVEWRAEHGRFRSVRQLLDVRGIGEAKYEALRTKVKV